MSDVLRFPNFPFALLVFQLVNDVNPAGFLHLIEVLHIYSLLSLCVGRALLPSIKRLIVFILLIMCSEQLLQKEML